MPDRAETIAGRPLGLLDVLCIGVNAIVGSSIFLFPGLLAQRLGPASILAFGLTGLLLLPVALCFAAAARSFDRPGGPYLYARAAFGDRVGFAVGWLCWITEVFSWAAVADGIASYLGYFSAAWTAWWAVKGVAAGVIVTMGALNYRGVKLGAWTLNCFTAGKLVPLALFVLLGLPRLRAANFAPFFAHGWAPMGKACFLAYFAFSGFEVVPVPAGEVRDPRRNIPLAVLGSMAFAAILYMSIQAVAVGVHPGIAGSPRPLADAAAAFLGPPGAAMLALGAVISTIGFNAGCALGGPRYLVALAQDGHLPPGLARIHSNYGTPNLAVGVTTLLALAAALTLDFNRLVDFSNVAVCAQYVGTCAAAPLLRRGAAGNRSRGVPGRNWLLPALGIGSTLWLGSQAGAAEIRWTAVTLAAGFAARRLLGAFPSAASPPLLPQ